jgi:hypothetical protein
MNGHKYKGRNEKYGMRGMEIEAHDRQKMNEGIMQGNLSRRDFYHRVFYEK